MDENIDHIVLSLIWNIYGEALLVLKNGLWMLPGGHTEFAENGITTAARENLEEIETEAAGYRFLLRHDSVEDNKHRIFEIFEGVYVGKDIGRVSLIGQKEGIKDVKWFPLFELKDLELTDVTSVAIKKSTQYHQLGGDFIQRQINRLQNVMLDTKLVLSPDSKLISKIEKKTLELSRLIDKTTNENFKKKVKRGVVKSKSRDKIVAVIEDNIDMLDTLQSILETNGFGVVTFNNPLEAIKSLSKVIKDIDIILTDQKMPGMKGTTLIKRLKRIRPEIKTILMSGYPAENYIGQFLQKPVKTKKLVSLIQQI